MSKSILELAKEHMNERYRGRYYIDPVKNQMNRKEVNCIMCKRPMTTSKTENPPYFCYRCDDESEGVFGLG